MDLALAALAMRQQLFRGDHSLVATSLNNLTFCLELLGQSTGALTTFEAVLEMCQRLLQGDHLQVAARLHIVAHCLQSLGRSTEALPKYLAAQEMAETV